MELREDIAKLEEMIASIKKQPEPVKEDKYVEGSRMYKGYDMKWLRGEPQHPEFYLVAEYDKKYGKVE